MNVLFRWAASRNKRRKQPNRKEADTYVIQQKATEEAWRTETVMEHLIPTRAPGRMSSIR